ncbi:hypothetical protein FEE95_00860 [Maribacter algarum]|uniref:Uncharacterized protein n=1 Tax=Maribacter algarum (ex Zhang et al. 2020) TaxID=2578118 RepID=A0A5S3PSX9_9FLAO|nr:contractile injection system tape measure protein [Maribacter algarum]TMM58008.1 hypothetical protein FEE95_00860 [Maribacter algarum]
MNQNSIHDALITIDLYGDENTGFDSNDLLAWTKSNVLEAIEDNIDSLVTSDSIVEISELNITISLDHKVDFLKGDDTIKALVWDQIYSALKNTLKEKTTIRTPVQTYRASIILKYIQTGQLATDYSNEEWSIYSTAFFDDLMIGTNLAKIGGEIIFDKNTFSRFFELIEPVRLDKILDKLENENNTAIKIKALLRFVVENSNNFLPITAKDLYYKAFFHLLQVENTFEFAFEKLIDEFVVQKRIHDGKLKVPDEVSLEIKSFLKKNIFRKEDELGYGTEATKENESETEIEILEEGSFIGQAGLVLLAPFLSLFLKKLGCLGSKGEPLKPNEVPILLHYLATGEHVAPEWKLTLPKILSGLRPGQHCATQMKPSKKIDVQINELLKSVITYWEALKNTSPEGLRETFLIREGELKFKNGFYYLFVDMKTVDILLNYISWNYTTVKLGWMQQILFVEWNKT